MTLSWKGSGQKLYGNLLMRWLWMEPDFMHYEIWSCNSGGWCCILEINIP